MRQMKPSSFDWSGVVSKIIFFYAVHCLFPKPCNLKTATIIAGLFDFPFASLSWLGTTCETRGGGGWSIKPGHSGYAPEDLLSDSAQQ